MSTSSNMRTVEIHRDAVVIAPGSALDNSVQTLIFKQRESTCRSQQHFELGDCEGKSPYRVALSEIDAAIGSLKCARREMQVLAIHRHEWNGDDYCVVCGADGHA